MTTPLMTLRYMTKFRCIADRCEDHCCAGWAVLVDEARYKGLQQCMDQTAEERAKYKTSISWDKNEHIARMNMADDGSCPFLTDNNLCHIHGRYGEALLPVGCSLYPRSLTNHEGSWELTGALSCPEIARLLLLDDQGADLTETDRSIMAGQPMLPQAEHVDNHDLYAKSLDPIRQTLHGLLSLRHYPVSHRLFFVVWFANRLLPFHYSGSPPFQQERLDNAIADICDQNRLAEISAEFATIDVSPKRLLSLIHAILISRSIEGKSKLQKLLFDIWDTNNLAHAGIQKEQPDRPNFSPNNLLQTYRQVLEAVYDCYGPRVEKYFENYAKNYFIKEWFTKSESLLIHTRSLLVRVATLKFLLFNHPAMVERFITSKVPMNKIETETLIDQTAVEVFQTFSKGIEHTSTFLQKIEDDMADEDVEPFAFTTCLALF